MSFPSNGESGRNEAHVFAPVGVNNDDDATDRVDADRDKPPLFLRRILDGDGQRVEQHALGIGEADAMLSAIRLSLGRIPDGLHVCIICILLRASSSFVGPTLDFSRGGVCSHWPPTAANLC